MRSASWGVVMEPSTRERSYGPFTTALEASTKFAISISPVRVSNSSSQSSRLNWQPSHEANFQTASFGLRFAGISDLSLSEQLFYDVIAEYRPVFADKRRPKLTVSAESDSAFHVTFHRKINSLGCDA